MTGYQSKRAAAQDKLDSMEREALKLAQQVLEDLPGFRADIDNAITAIKAALAQPPQRIWVGLTEPERNDLEDYCEMIIGKAAFDAIEAKLKEKNT